MQKFFRVSPFDTERFRYAPVSERPILHDLLCMHHCPCRELSNGRTIRSVVHARDVSSSERFRDSSSVSILLLRTSERSSSCQNSVRRIPKFTQWESIWPPFLWLGQPWLATRRATRLASPGTGRHPSVADTLSSLDRAALLLFGGDRG